MVFVDYCSHFVPTGSDCTPRMRRKAKEWISARAEML
jgi:hypothetical protein